MFESLLKLKSRGIKHLSSILMRQNLTWFGVLYLFTLLLVIVCNGAGYEKFDVEVALLTSAGLTFLLAFLTLPQRLYRFKLPIVLVFNTFMLLTYWYISTNNSLVFFFIYELFLLPSSYLVYSVSPNKRAVKSTTYFVWWTQAGSMLVLGGLLLQIVSNGTLYFNEVSHINTLAGLLILLGFGVKIPIFPFFFWLTKTHVEAITSFSIFLSGFLVKLAVFGIVKFQIFNNPTLVAIVLPLTLVSIVVASVGFIYQTDYKKIIAYATVQEMNILTLLYLLTVQYDNCAVSNLLIVHTLLSGLFFTIADLLYKKYNSRALKSLKGLLQLAPKMASFVLGAILVFKGLPYTAKFPIEFTLYSSLLQESKLLFIFLIICVVFIGNLFFTLVNVAVLFGSTKTNVVTDLTTREFSSLLFPILWLVLYIL